MKVKKIELNNFRAFKHLEINFNDRLNIFVGVNGAGKSSILDSLAILLSHLIGKIQSSHSTGRQFSDMDIQLGTSETVNTIDLSYKKQTISWTVTKTKRGRKKQIPSNRVQIKEIVELVQAEQEQNENASFPLAVYYAVNRAVLDIPLRILNKHQFDQLAAYDRALTGTKTDFSRFFEWFRNQEDFENEQRLYSAKNKQAGQNALEYRDPQLQAVRDAIQALTGFSGLRVVRNPLRMEVRKGEQVLDVRHLSNGEKCLFALAGDLARRLAIANPGLDKPLTGSGVVVIDEVDLHLHPEWQRLIITKLLDTFPGCQFILSTHSPHIITHVQPENLFLLKQTNGDVTIEKPNESYGKNVDRVLEDLMGLATTRPDQVEDRLHQIFLDIQAARLQKARKEISSLKQEIGDDPELVKAEVLIKRMEIIGK